LLHPSDDKNGGHQGTLRPPRRRGVLGYLGPAVALVLIAYAAIVIYRMATHIDPREIGVAMETMAPWRFAVALALTVISVVSLAAYDVCAILVIRTRRPVDLGYAALCGGISNVFANGLGFPILTGGTARYRLYSMIGLDFSAVGRIMALTWVTMWSGLVFVLALALTFVDGDREPVVFGPLADRFAGLALFALLAATVVWIGRKRRAIRIAGWTVRLPTTPVLIGMILAGGVDMLASGMTLYILLPPDTVPSLSIFVIAYIVAILAGNAANTPGGIGVFEATMVTGLDLPERPDVAAALILFRIIYFLLPLMIALAVFGLVEWRYRRRRRLAGAEER